MDKVIFSLVGPSGCGKSTLIVEMLRRFPSRLAIIKSVTTRPKRSAEDDLNYRFVSIAEFEELRDGGRLIQGVEYAGQCYGNDRADAEDVFDSGRHGINAMVEDGVRNFRKAGYRIAAIRILPVGEYDGRTDERKRVDAARMNDLLVAEYEIENRFEPGGKEAAIESLATYIGSYIEGLEAIGPVS